MMTPAHGGNWGILGGAFDPIHLGHITLASEIAEAASLTGVLFVPSYRHPFKTGEFGASFANRVRMLQLATWEHESFIVSEIEHEQDLSGYTVDMIGALKNRYPRAQLNFLIGADNLTDLPKWRQPSQLLDAVRMLVGSRPGSDPISSLEASGLPTDRIEVIESRPIDVSSTEIRQLVKSDASDEIFADLLCGKVLEYIRENGLYR